MQATTSQTLTHAANPVKSLSPVTSDTSPDSMIHHKVSPPIPYLVLYKNKTYSDRRYGVSQAHRLIPRELFLKKYDLIRNCLEYRLGLQTAQREVVLRLVRLWSYYGKVYPKASQVCHDPGCSKATYWRTIRIMKDVGLVLVINRFVIRPHAQISNLYRLDKLVLLLARYLAEHIAHVWPDWVRSALAMPVREFCHSVFQSPGVRAGPLIAASLDF